MSISSNFRITSVDAHSYARCGMLATDHGVIQTPVFMPVATQAVFKGGVDTLDALNSGAKIILSNTYHLYVRGMVDVINRAGGLHSFMQWDNPILTDSGGFQVWSLSKRRNNDACMHKKGSLTAIDARGVTFNSHLYDGKQYRLTPEEAVRIQQDLGADIIMAFDEATSDTASFAYAKEAMERTHAWASRSLCAHSGEVRTKGKKVRKQLLFGIAQGGKFKRLRKKSAQFIASLDFDGIALGGESIGYAMRRTKHLLAYLAPFLPRNKPLYTMGVGFLPTDFFTVVESGADMFDCVAPARIARHGSVYVREVGPRKKYHINLLNACYKYDFRPLCRWCDCVTCARYSRAYLRHLFKAHEPTALRLATIHNLRFMLKVMEEIRTAITAGAFMQLKKEWLSPKRP